MTTVKLVRMLAVRPPRTVNGGVGPLADDGGDHRGHHVVATRGRVGHQHHHHDRGADHHDHHGRTDHHHDSADDGHQAAERAGGDHDAGRTGQLTRSRCGLLGGC